MRDFVENSTTFKEEIERVLSKRVSAFCLTPSHNNRREGSISPNESAVHNQKRGNQTQYFADYSALRESSHEHLNHSKLWYFSSYSEFWMRLRERIL